MTRRHLIGHLRTLWRTERVVTELRLQRLLTNLGLQALAAFVTVCALLLFELAAYFALIQKWDAIWSAVALGLCDLIVAGLIGLIATRRPAGRELALAQDLHQQAISAFEDDLQDGRPLRAAIESVATSVLLPLVPLMIERLRKHATEAAHDQAA